MKKETDKNLRTRNGFKGIIKNHGAMNKNQLINVAILVHSDVRIEKNLILRMYKKEQGSGASVGEE
ncbi:hypothetical protein [Metabacillus niabensis]|uniref:hypothetical protein n=1 Tax=Metabacillus niabensis TaxID=324854 RepID=UPI001CFB1582|nr:hypothetical protein [Metabacillus niabensis]